LYDFQASLFCNINETKYKLNCEGLFVLIVSPIHHSYIYLISVPVLDTSVEHNRIKGSSILLILHFKGSVSDVYYAPLVLCTSMDKSPE